MTETMISFSSFSSTYLYLYPFLSLYLCASFSLVTLSVPSLLFISFFILFFEFISNHHHCFSHISFWSYILGVLYTFWWIVPSWNSLIWAWYACSCSTLLFCSCHLYTACIWRLKNQWQEKTKLKSFSHWNTFHWYFSEHFQHITLHYTSHRHFRRYDLPNCQRQSYPKFHHTSSSQ